MNRQTKLNHKNIIKNLKKKRVKVMTIHNSKVLSNR